MEMALFCFTGRSSNPFSMDKSTNKLDFHDYSHYWRCHRPSGTLFLSLALQNHCKKRERIIPSYFKTIFLEISKFQVSKNGNDAYRQFLEIRFIRS